MINLFAISVITEDPKGDVNSSRDFVHVLAKDEVDALYEIQCLIGKTYAELGWESSPWHYRILDCSYPTRNSINIHLPEEAMQQQLQAMEDRVVRRIMQYIDQLREPREV